MKLTLATVAVMALLGAAMTLNGDENFKMTPAIKGFATAAYSCGALRIASDAGVKLPDRLRDLTPACESIEKILGLEAAK